MLPDDHNKPVSARTVIFTVGHSTHSLDEFLHLLQHYQITLLVDVRTIPRSRHNPQFNLEALSTFLHSHHISYLHLKQLGGLRHARKHSVNTGWDNASFRGFADYMQTPEFEQGLQLLMEKARDLTTAVMCAESVPWRCHRSLIADALTSRGIEVNHILTITHSKIHTLSSMAKMQGVHITYPYQPGLM
jgi:uncharacterized protein (DUF488 family)